MTVKIEASCRKPFYSVKVFRFELVLLFASLSLISCKCPINEHPSRLESETCLSYEIHIDAICSDVFNSHVNLELVTYRQENRCSPVSNSFYFRAKPNGLVSNEVFNSVFESENLSDGFKHVQSSLNWSIGYGIFKLLGSSTVICSLPQQSDNVNTRKNGSSKRGDSVHDVIKSEVVPFVEIKPASLEWDRKNTDLSGTLSIYDPYSSKFSETLVDPGEFESLCFVFFQTKLGFLSARITIRTSSCVGKNLSAADSSYISICSLSVRNDAPNLLSVRKFYSLLETSEVDLRCKPPIVVNNSESSRIEISCPDVISLSLGHRLEVSEHRQHVHMNGISKSFIDNGPKTKEKETSEGDVFVLRSRKSQTSASSTFVRSEFDLVFQTVHVGKYRSRWISVRNPSKEPVLVQLILSSLQLIDNCRTEDSLYQSSSSSSIILSEKQSVAPKRFGFSLANDAITEAFIHPYGIAYLGPILFQPSNLCEWRSSALIRNNLSGVESLSLRGAGGSLSLMLLEGSNPVKTLKFKIKPASQSNVSSPESQSSGCREAMVKSLRAKNSGDLPLDVIKIKISGVECGSDGFRISNCKGFSLQPGEFIAIQISYQSDFESATIYRDLEVVLAAGIVVIPMKASLPLFLLDFCRKSMFWMRLKKAMFLILFSVLLLLVVYPFFLQVMADSSRRIETLPAIVKDEEKSFEEDEVFSFESSSSRDVRSESRLVPSESLSDSINRDELNSINQRIRKRRKKKKKSVSSFEISSSQSGNSTPSSPLSPSEFTVPTQSPPLSPGIENEKPVAFNSDKRYGSSKSDRLNCKIRATNRDHVGEISVKEKTSSIKKVADSGAAFLPPGHKLDIEKNGKTEGSSIKEEGKFVYNMWDDYMFGYHSIYPINDVSRGPNLLVYDNFESFFVKDPMDFFKNIVPKSDLEVYK